MSDAAKRAVWQSLGATAQENRTTEIIAMSEAVRLGLGASTLFTRAIFALADGLQGEFPDSTLMSKPRSVARLAF